MSEHEYGADVAIDLPNPIRRVLAIAGLIAIVGVLPQLLPDKGDGRAMLFRIVGYGLLAVAGWFVFSLRGLFVAKKLTLVVTSKRVELPVVPGRPRRGADLEDIRDVLVQSQGGRRQGLLLELRDGRKLVLDALTLPAELESRVAQLIAVRSALRRAGVRSRRELAAAEAYLAARRQGATPFGVRVAKGDDTHVGDVALVTAVDDAARDEGALYVPASAYAVLAQTGAATDNMKPLRGVD